MSLELTGKEGQISNVR